MQEEVKWLKVSFENMLLRVMSLIGEPISAGIKPSSQLNPVVVQAMGEVGMDIKQQKPKDITEDMMRNSTKIVNMVVWISRFVLHYSSLM